jgi:Rrf2 family protein
MPHSTNTQFAVGVHMLTLLADGGPEPLSSENMAASAEANPVYVRRVLGRLREAGIVSSRPGVGGGWVLLRDPAAITLGDVWRAIQADDRLLGLHQVNPRCAVGQAIQHHLATVDRRASAAVESELDQITVAQMLPARAHALPNTDRSARRGSEARAVRR